MSETRPMAPRGKNPARREGMDLLLHPVFLAALGALLLNDWILKPQFHNAVTGKLSDVAGVAAFALFLAALFPRHILAGHAVTALLFTIWKLPLSGGFIHWLNGWMPFPVGRTVDPTDLFALPVLGVSAMWLVRRATHATGGPAQSPCARWRRVVQGLAMVTAMCAFVATSIGYKSFDFQLDYLYSSSEDELLRRIEQLNGSGWPIPPCAKHDLRKGFDVNSWGDERLEARFTVKSSGTGSVLRLIRASKQCTDCAQEDVQKLFESVVVTPLRSPQPMHYSTGIRITRWSAPDLTDAERRVLGGPCEGCEWVFEGLEDVAEVTGRTTPTWEKGERMRLVGVVRHADGTPAAGVIVYAYHTDSQGVYPPLDGALAAVRHGRLRGWVRTCEDGTYAFDMIRPGAYPGRDTPAHVHMHVIEPGVGTYWIDDVMFTDDPLLTDAERARQQQRGGPGIVTPLRLADGAWSVTRDIDLGRNIPGHPDEGKWRPAEP